MFWKKKPSDGLEDAQSKWTEEVARTADERRVDAERNLAESLRQYYEAALETACDGTDPEWEEAREKVEKARALVIESRLAYALGRCIPEHIEYWSSWIKREDFQKYVGFEASEISASREEGADEDVSDRKTEIVEFTFNGSRYRFTLFDNGFSLAPGDEASKWGYVELHFQGKLVARFQVGQDCTREYSHWTYADVKALKVGEWMKDILKIAAQIDASKEDFRKRLISGFDGNTAKDIEL